LRRPRSPERVPGAASFGNGRLGGSRRERKEGSRPFPERFFGSYSVAASILDRHHNLALHRLAILLSGLELELPHRHLGGLGETVIGG